VILRAQELLEELEAARDRRSPPRRPRREAPLAGQAQLPLFAADGALARELAALDVDSLTPLQAITKLYELAERARETLGP